MLRLKTVLKDHHGNFKVYDGFSVEPVATQESSKVELRKLRNKKVYNFGAVYDPATGECYTDILLA